MDESHPLVLLKVPPEILGEIAAYLGAKDFGSLRLTCRAVERASFHQFSRQFFETMWFVMPAIRDLRSLQELVDISAHPSLSKALRHVTLATDELITFKFRTDGRFGALPPVHHEWTSQQLEPVLVEVGAHDAARRYRGVLAGVFARLVNLETITLQDTTYGYGCMAETESFYAYSGFGNAFVARQRCGLFSQMTRVTLGALADAGSRPENMGIHCTGQFSLSHRGVDDENSDTSLPQGLFTSLKKLSLSFGDDRVPGEEHCIQRVLSLTRDLVSLSLAAGCPGSSKVAFLKWLGQRPDASHPTDTIDAKGELSPTCLLPRLRRLEIGNIQPALPPAVLQDIVRKFSPSLRALRLYDVTLVDEESSVKARFNIWKSVFNFIAEESRLTEWDFSDLSITMNGASARAEWRFFVHWPSGHYDILYAGADAKAKLQVAAEDMVMQGPSDSESEDDEADDTEDL